MINEKKRDDFSTPERFNQSRRAEDRAKGLDPDEDIKSEAPTKDLKLPRALRDVQYDKPEKDNEPGKTEW